MSPPKAIKIVKMHTPPLLTRWLPWAAGWILAACPLACHNETDPLPAFTRAAPAEPGAAAAPGAALPTPSALAKLEPVQEQALQSWFTAVGARMPDEPFGELLVRVGKHQMGKPYFDAPWVPGPEVLECDLTSFQCVSFVESSLSLARCVWRGETTSGCFLHELQDTRYRNGVIDGYPSRLHYYEEWLIDNSHRGHLRTVTGALGGKPHPMVFSFMSTHPDDYPALQDANIRTAIAATEATLSRQVIYVLDRDQVAHAEAGMQTGDVIAITTAKAGILISHTGLISKDTQGVAHLLHASSLRKHVVLTENDLADYLSHGRDRRGVLVARPLAP